MRSTLTKLIAAAFFSGFTLAVIAAPDPCSVTPARLRCEYRVDPLGIDSPNPRLDWILLAVNPAARNLAQSAYEVLAASSPTLLAANQGDLWDSGKVASDQMNQVPYSGKSLAASQQVWWKVRVWDQTGAPTAWSPAGQWTMGLLGTADWSGAKWIAAPDSNQPNAGSGPKPSYETVLLRREFTVKPNLRRALVHVCGLGQYEMTLNGSKVGDDLFTPGWTWYTKTCLYNTYDITSALRMGPNAAGLFLGNGFFNIHKGRYTKVTGSFGPVQAIAVIRLEYLDGSVDTIVTDDHWKTASGPITFSSIYGGEDYDARLVQEGWDTPGFNDSAWETPAITSGPGGALKGLSAAGPPVRTFDVLKPLTGQANTLSASPGNTPPLPPNVTVYDLGQNASIMLRLKVTGPAGSSIKVTPSELLKPNGDINDTMNRADSYWTYTLSGKGDESYFSHFYYRGGRYLKAELRPAPGSTELPTLESIEGDTIRADAPAVGQFSCSNQLYNKIYNLIRWAQMNNMMSVMTDCPTREKLGWLEEDHLNGPALRYNFDLSTLLTKMVCDMADSQRPSGLVPSTCPNYLRLPEKNRFANPPEWGSACIIVPWQQYEFDGDLDILRSHYDTMKTYVAYLTAAANGNIVNFGLGDWYDNHSFGAATLTPIALTATAFYYEDACMLSQVAAMLGKTADASTYKQLATQILAAFNQKFFNPATNAYATNSQASNAVPLAMHMVDPSARPAVLQSLVADFEAKQTTVGEVCLEFLLNALAEGGCSDAIYNAYLSETSGYGLQVKLGKTSMTEGWNGGASQDHFMFGELNEWLFSHLAGIQCDPSGPGFKKIVIQPTVVGDLTEVKASYDSISGKIISEWRRSGSNVRLHVVIPPNTSATIYLPGNPTAPSHVGSGEYTFDSSLPH
jgi:alpha-L-rhamnosidase